MKFIYVTDCADNEGMYLNAAHIVQIYGDADGKACVHLTDRDEPVTLTMTPYQLMELIHE